MIISSSHFVSLIKGNNKASQVLIPELIKKLVKSSIGSKTNIRCPSGDDTYLPGFDLEIKNNTVEHRFVPLGDVFMEIGVKTSEKSAIEKLLSDYSKRKDRKDLLNSNNSTYIGVTTFPISLEKK